MFTRGIVGVAALGAVLLAACSSPEPREFADGIYTGGDIVTLNPAQPTAEAVAVAKGKILAVGPHAEIVSAYAGATGTRFSKSHSATRSIHLAGKTLLPGFIDVHGDYLSSLAAVSKDMSPDSVLAAVRALTRELVIERTPAVQMRYASAGFTTARDGETNAGQLEMLQHASASGANLIDVVAFPSVHDLDRVLPTNPASRWGTYINRLKIGGVEMAPEDAPSIARVRELGVPHFVRESADTTAPPDPMHTLWSVVNGASPVPPLDALRAFTIDAAAGLGDEASKGSIEPGKLADFVVLDRNPLTVDPMQIKDIVVLETIKDGVTIFTREATSPPPPPSPIPEPAPTPTAHAPNDSFQATVPNTTAPPADAPDGMVWIPGGEFSMGAADPVGNDMNDVGMHATEDSRPIHRVYVDGFWMDATEVTNAQFARFVQATSYVTVAEHTPRAEDFPDAPPENLVAGSVVFLPPDHSVPLHDHFQWWTYVHGANWRHPLGPDSDLTGRENYPVVHVAYADAMAYARWAGKRLPTEAEWEFAARGGSSGHVYPWGNEFQKDGTWMANSFQGHFPDHDTGDDAFVGVAPVAQYPANAYGLYDVAGNVWEWTSDWYRHDSYKDLAAAGVARNPRGPSTPFDPSEPGEKKRVHRGGSFLCTDQYCSRYMVGTRAKGEVNTGTNHLGFRCVRKP